MMRVFWGLVAVLIFAAAVWLVRGGSSGSGASPSTGSKPDAGPVSVAAPAPPPPSPAVSEGELAKPAPTPAPTPTPAPSEGAPAPSSEATASPAAPSTPANAAGASKLTGITQESVEEAFTEAFPGLTFKAGSNADGRRRAYGTIGEARLPAVEVMGDPGDLSQVSAMGSVLLDDKPATIEQSPFATLVLDLAMPEWSERREWLARALAEANESETNHQASHTHGPLAVTFSSWRSLGVYKLSVETVASAEAYAAAANMGQKLAGRQESRGSGAGEPDAGASSPGTADGSASGEAAAAKIETKEDGTLLIDGRYPVKGKGTKEEPYEITWDQLVSVQDDYVPRDGRKEIPGRAAMLDGKWVRITGNIAFPLMADAAEECLVMMNQWDGCCIGIPPTPYDAVEVRLKDPATGNARFTTYGVVVGKFKVEAHLVGGWLVGLFLMDDATLKPETYGGFAP